MRIRAFILCTVGLLLLGGSARSAVSSDEPFQNGSKALARSDFSDAEKWFVLTHKDFSASLQGNQALVHETAIVVSRELSRLKLAGLFREGSALSRLDNRPGPSYRRRASAYEEEARSAAANLLRLIPELLAAKSLEQTLKFQIDTAGWDVDDLEAKVKKGEPLEDREVAKLERGEMLKSYIGFWGTLFEFPEDRVFQSSYEATLKPVELFKAIGSRAFLSNQTTGNREALDLAVKALERVKDLTKDTPYDRSRQEAQEFLDKVNKLREGKAKIEKRCPIDQALMQPDWKFCPIHGEKL